MAYNKITRGRENGATNEAIVTAKPDVGGVRRPGRVFLVVPEGARAMCCSSVRVVCLVCDIYGNELGTDQKCVCGHETRLVG